jgi:hypothetical protein
LVTLIEFDNEVTKEEADTRMILQALHADKRLKELGKQGRIIIKTSDTDVIVLCIYFYKQMNTPVNCGFKWETLLVLRTVDRKTLVCNEAQRIC